MKIGFLTRSNELNGSSRVRALQYVSFLEEAGFEVRVLRRETRTGLFHQGGYLFNALKLARWADVVFLQKPNQSRKLLDLIYGLNSRLVVDVDDAVWSKPPTKSGPAADAAANRFSSRLRHAIKRANFVVAGSNYISEWVSRQCPGSEISVIPPSVNLNVYNHLKVHAGTARPATIGWIGSNGNLHDIMLIIDELRYITEAGQAVLRIIAGSPPSIDVTHEFEQWALQTEVEALMKLDIGIMPLWDDERSRGRCGYKAIQYMAAGIPVVVSPVGAGKEVVKHGRTGFHARTGEEWLVSLRRLIESPSLRAEMGRKAAEEVKDRYSVQSNLPKLIDVIKRRYGTTC
jgi:glycosyltransferase involved in cell wall biosynthesis